MGTDDLVTWLREQLDEDEREIVRHPDGEDAFMAGDLVAAVEQNYPCSPYLQISKARALREVEAKRRILDLAALATQHEAQNADDPVRRLEKALAKVTAPALERVVRLLALSYADRPGYRQEWAPGDG